MLIEVQPKVYNTQFQESPHPFISSGFINLNEWKVDRVVRLLEDKNKVSIGIIAGIKDNILKSPFSAPFGGFHFRSDNMYTSEIESFITELVKYVIGNNLAKLEIVLPPSIYHLSFNTKLVNILLRKGFKMMTPDITNWVDLNKFQGVYTNKTSRKYYRQALRNKLKFELLNNLEEENIAYNIISENRKRLGRSIFMSFQDIQDIRKLWPVDFFGIKDKDYEMIAGGVFYRGHRSIVQGIFWGDNEEGRPQRAIDFLSLNVWNYYKDAGFDAIDLGISTEAGVPNEGLLRFKESHDCFSSLKFNFCWENNFLKK